MNFPTNNGNGVFAQNQARMHMNFGGAAILLTITALSCVSSFVIYSGGFGDMPWIVQQALSLFTVIVVEGAFAWLVYGFNKVFGSKIERRTALFGIVFLVLVMGTNLVTHFMMAKGLALHPAQDAWINWGAVTVFLAILALVLVITLANPAARLTRMELQLIGRRQEAILQSKVEELGALATLPSFDNDDEPLSVFGGASPAFPK